MIQATGSLTTVKPAVPERPAPRPITEATPEPADRKPSRKAFIGTIGFTLAVFLLTMPRWFYPGDNFTPRAEAVSLLSTGELGIPYAHRAGLGEFVAVRGKYFFENDERQRFFPKYGIAYTLLYTMPVGLERALSGDTGLLPRSPSLLLWLNGFNLGFSALVVAYLWKLAGLYSSRNWLRAAFVLASIFGTMMWFYLRAHAHDVFQLAAFLAFAFHTLTYLRGRAAAPRGESARGLCGHLLAANFALALLIHMRFSFGVLYAPLFLAALLAGSERGWTARLWRNLRYHGVGYAAGLVLPAAVAIGSLLFVQWYRFGSPWDHGYTQWAVDPDRSWNLAHAPGQLVRYFVAAGNANVFIHFPMLLFALAGVPIFLRRHRLEYGFLAACSAFLLLPLLGMPDEGYGYGPRYLLQAAAVLSLPWLASAAWCCSRPLKATKVAAAACFACAIGLSALMQFYMNSAHYFGYFIARDHITALARETSAEQPVQDYFRPVHRGLVHRDLLRYRRGEQPFAPAVLALNAVDPERRPAAEAELHDALDRAAASNFLLFEMLKRLGK